MPCYRFWAASNEGNRTWELSYCGQSASYTSIPGDSLNSAWLTIDGVSVGRMYWGPPHALRGIEINTNPQGNDCLECRNENPPPSPQYDCVNGACVEKQKYSTPGIYESLSECEKSCGPGCGGVCISNSDWAKISNLAAMVKNKDCS